jgi:hypothetical protein
MKWDSPHHQIRKLVERSANAKLTGGSPELQSFGYTEPAVRTIPLTSQQTSTLSLQKSFSSYYLAPHAQRGSLSTIDLSNNRIRALTSLRNMWAVGHGKTQNYQENSAGKNSSP